MEARKRVFSYDEDAPGKRHQGEDHGHLSRGRANSRSASPQGAARSRSMSPNGAPQRYNRGGSPRRDPPRGPPRERSFSPNGAAPHGNGHGPHGGPGPHGGRGGRGGRGRVCMFWRQTDSCKFDTECTFAHSMSGILGRVSPSPKEGPPPQRGGFMPRGYQSPDRNGGPPGRRGGRHDDRGPPMRRGGMRPRSRSPHGRPGGPGGPGGPGRMEGKWTVCHFWKTADNCKYGDNCKFLHSFPEPGAGPPPRRDFPPPGRPARRSFSPPRQNYPPRGPRMSPGRDGGRPIVWNHDVSPRQQQRYDYEPNRNFSPARHPGGYSPPRRERSRSPKRYDRGPSPRYMSPPPRGMSPGRYHSPPRRMSPRGRSPQPRYDGHGSPRGRRDHFSPPTQYRGQPGPRRGGGHGPKREICYFFQQKQGCRNADQCNFIHSKPAEGVVIERPDRADRPPRRERPARGEGSSPNSRDSSPA